MQGDIAILKLESTMPIAWSRGAVRFSIAFSFQMKMDTQEKQEARKQFLLDFNTSSILICTNVSKLFWGWGQTTTFSEAIAIEFVSSYMFC